MIRVGRGWKKKMRQQRKDSDDFFHNPGYDPAQCPWENFTAAITAISKNLPYRSA